MNRKQVARCVVIVTVLLMGAAPLVAQPSQERYIVKFRRGGGQAVKQAINAAGGSVVLDLSHRQAVAALLPGGAVQGLSNNPNVAYIEIDPKRYPLSHDPSGQVTPYGIPMVQADQVIDANAWNRSVCIIDSGADVAHADLSGNNISASLENGPFVDEINHGTHVTGTIAAINNAEGVVGVLPSANVQLHLVKVFTAEGFTYSSGLVGALDDCIAAGANVVNMSLGGPLKSRFEDRAFKDAFNKNNVLSAAAAGNSGNNRHSYPASYNSVISVAAIDQNKVVADFSQQTSQVELSAPGVGVLSTVVRDSAYHTELTVGSDSFAAEAMEGAPFTTGSGPLVDCGLGDSLCAGAGGAACLIQRGNITFADKVQNCEASGGNAAIIYNNVSGPLFGTLAGAVTTIPSVGVSDTDGSALLGRLGETATVTLGPDSYAFFDGTSMATPHVSGVAALVWSHDATCTNADIRNALTATAEDLGDPGRDNAYGFGLVQARAALDSLSCDSGGGDPPPPGCDLGSVGDPCTSNGDCCSNKCKGKPGNKTCR